MSIFDSVNNGIKEAMLSKDKVRLEALRAIKKEFIEAKTAKGASGELTDEAAMKILAKMVKQRKESAEIFVSNNRSDLADANLAEAAIIEEFLPARMSEAELEEALKEIIARLGATSPQQMGMVMGAATKQLAGRADGRAISDKVKELLSK
ncbi:MAG: GatB/YqeY domain-containing protein [Bacteroidetes bacterium]|uniref:GatB/YqeY domain-containing protein n=1 Tax=Candidatus Caccoplasma merdipullorum TaxID=2840718 RepID=A0A9D9E5C6_9BACT|nr:GatB/YqeY domain-containing protein [Candidatus Caccoplasma merdipullorum]